METIVEKINEAFNNLITTLKMQVVYRFVDIQWNDMVDSVNDGVSIKVAFRSAQFIS